MEQLHDKILAKRAETERQLGQISAAIDVAMRSATAGALEAGGQPAAAFLALPRFQVSAQACLHCVCACVISNSASDERTQHVLLNLHKHVADLDWRYSLRLLHA